VAPPPLLNPADTIYDVTWLVQANKPGPHCPVGYLGRGFGEIWT